MEYKQLQKSEEIRDVIRYLQKFKNAVAVIYLDDKTIHSDLFSSHICDIALLHSAGIKVVIIPGARTRIDQILNDSKLNWTYQDNIRITSEEAMPLIKMAAFDVSNTIMTSLAANNITATIGNWVRARAKGVVDGLDYGTAGEIDRLQVEAIKKVLEDGFIPIFPCIGWNSVGHPYNISTLNLAQQVAIELKADKLFFVMQDINGLLKDNQIIPAMNLEEVDAFLEKSKNNIESQSVNILNLAKEACKKGVSRTHIVDGKLDGVLLTEIYSNLGSGTMIYTSNYGKIRSMEQTDIPAVLALMKPFIESGKLLPRSEEVLSKSFQDYVVYEIDGAIHASAALHLYQDCQAEIAAVAVDENYAHMGIGPKIINFLIDKAKKINAKSVFILTTQAGDWFEKLGFKKDEVDSLPAERKAIWNPKRNSKVYRLK